MKRFLMLGTAIIAMGGASQAMAQTNYPVKSSDTTLGQARYIDRDRQAQMQAVPSEEILRTEPAAGGNRDDIFTDFTGPYIGASASFDTTSVDITDPAGPDGDLGMDGFTGGVFVGYGYQGSQMLAGIAGYGSVEVGYERSGTDGTLGVNSYEKNHSWHASFRPGLSINNGTLGYGIIGYSRTEFDATGADEEDLNGLVLGAGTEFNTRMPLRMRIEYAYTNYEDENIGAIGFDAHESAIKAGALLRF